MSSFLCHNQYLPVVEQSHSGSYSLLTLAQSTVILNQPRTSGSIQLPAIIASRTNIIVNEAIFAGSCVNPDVRG
jgi:hypothetical protein